MHVIATAGHVDHGKSTLIQRLTGIDPDRLAEEKERGLTIDLGFAWLTTPGLREIGIVDVPGHERFIHNMLAGVGSLDATMFVVAANEGWKPQSEEHLQILEMLGARGAVVALTKADLVSLDEIEAAAAQIRDRLGGTRLADAEIVGVSGVTAAGIDELLAAIDRMIARFGAAPDRGRPRLFTDRAFTIKGVGTVVTGTLTGGSLRSGDTVRVLPSGLTARVRGIQSHRTVREEVHPISRVALNLAGIDVAQLARGDAVVAPDQWAPATELDVRLMTVRGLDHALTNRGAFKAYVGSAEVDVRLHLYERPRLGVGEESFARLSLTHPVVAAPFDRFVLRDTGRRQTVGGGVILDAHPPARLRGAARGERPGRLRARAAATQDMIPTLLVDERGVLPRADLPRLAGSDAAPRGCENLRSLVVSRSRYDQGLEAIRAALEAFHTANPLIRGAPREDIRTAAGIHDVRLFNEIVESATGQIGVDGPLIRLASHRVVLDVEEQRARDVLLLQMQAAGFKPPGLRSLIDSHGEALVQMLLDNGTLVKVGEDIVFTADQIDDAKGQIAAATQGEGPLTASAIRELLGTSRKYAIPLLEHLDATGFTRRRGDLRELVDQGRDRLNLDRHP